MTTSRLTDDQQAQVVRLLKLGGISQAALARSYSVSKDAIARVWQKHREVQHDPTTLGMRLDALNVKLNRVLAETTRDINQRIADA